MGMFTSVRGFWGAIGVALALIALYLVLENGTNASSVISAVAGGTSQVFKTLQARD